MLDAVVKQAGEDVSENYKVVYSLNEEMKGVSIEGNMLKVSSVADSGTLKPVVVVSLANASGEKVYDSFAKIEMNLNKAEPTPSEYLQGLLATVNLDYDIDGYEIICQDDVYNLFYGVKKLSSGDDKASIEWKCCEQKGGEWVESDLIDFETGKYTKNTDYDGTFKIIATATYKETQDKLDREFVCIAQDVYANIPTTSSVNTEFSDGKLITKAVFNGLSEDEAVNIFVVTYNKDKYIENIKQYDTSDLIRDGRNKSHLVQELKASSAEDNVYMQKVLILDKNFKPIAQAADTETSIEKITQNYAWLIDTYTDDSGAYKAEILTQNNEICEYEFADTVEFWGSDEEDEKENLSFKDDFDASKEKISESLANTQSNNRIPTGLVKFKTDSDGKINMLYMSVATYKLTEINSERPVIYNSNMGNYAGWDNVIGKRFYLHNNMIEFSIKTDYTSDAKPEYSVETVESSKYISYDGGIGEEFYLACFDGITANIAISIIPTNAEFTYNTADNNSTIMISEINKVDDGYEIVGYRNGEEVKYTTAYNVSVSEAVGISGGCYVNGSTGFTSDNNRHYGVVPIWTNSNSIPNYNGNPVISEENQAEYTALTDALSVGDIIGVKVDDEGNAKIIIKMFDMSEYVQDLKTVWGSLAQYSSTRDGISFGEICEIMSKDIIGADYDGVVMGLSTGEIYQIKDIDTVTMYNAASGEILNCDMNDLRNGDKVFIRVFGKKSIREIFAVRL